MAMTALHAGWPADRIEVEGIDRNAGFLNIAERGEFGASSVRTEVPPWAAQFLRHENESIAIDPAVRAVVRFRRADVTRPEAIRGTGPWNVVYCRNLLIYLNMSAREKLLESICTELSQDGLLFVGHAEQMIRCSIPLRIVPASHAFALQPMHPNEPPAKQPGRPARSPKPVVNTPRPPTPAPHAPMPATTSTTPPPLQEVDWLEDARVVADSGRATQAEEMIHAIITKRGPSAAALELLGMIRMSVNDTEGAKRLFEQALYLEQNRLGSLLQLAMISEKSGDERRAAKYWDRAKRASTSSHEEHRA